MSLWDHDILSEYNFEPKFQCRWCPISLGKMWEKHDNGPAYCYCCGLEDRQWYWMYISYNWSRDKYDFLGRNISSQSRRQELQKWIKV